MASYDIKGASGYLEIYWCGDNGLAELYLNNVLWRRWRTLAANPIKIKVPAAFHEDIIVRVQCEDGEIVEAHGTAVVTVSHSKSPTHPAFTRQQAFPARCARQKDGLSSINIGEPYSAIVEHPAGSTQFTYDGGRHALRLPGMAR